MILVAFAALINNGIFLSCQCLLRNRNYINKKNPDFTCGKTIAGIQLNDLSFLYFVSSNTEHRYD
uniref:Uncharacterized protein n=1 Tax=Trichobilharzia regenti TaxID=157069 RepID=A0AA85J768_TRIRE